MIIHNFFPLSGYEVNYINWFSNVKPILPSYNKPWSWNSREIRVSGSYEKVVHWLSLEPVTEEQDATTLCASPQRSLRNCPAQHVCPRPVTPKQLLLHPVGSPGWHGCPPKQFPLLESGPVCHWQTVSGTVMAGSCSQPARGKSCPSVPPTGIMTQL